LQQVALQHVGDVLDRHISRRKAANHKVDRKKIG
jgi:hypothetical protein